MRDKYVSERIQGMGKKAKKTAKRVKELRADSRGNVNFKEYKDAIEYLSTLMEPHEYRDSQGKLRSKETGRELVDRPWHREQTEAQMRGSQGRSLSPREIRAFCESRGL